MLNPSYQINLLNINKSQSITPATIFGSNLIGWYTSSDIVLNGSTVSQATNRVAGNPNLVQATAVNQPNRTTSALNGFNAIEHDSNIKGMGATGYNFNSVFYSAIVLRKISNSPDFGRVISITNGASQDFNNTQSICVLLRDGATGNYNSFYNLAGVTPAYAYPADANYRTFEILVSNSINRVRHWVNGNQEMDSVPATTLAINSNNLLMGGITSTTFDTALNMAWTELILCNATPSTQQQTSLRNYLRGKYAHY